MAAEIWRLASPNSTPVSDGSNILIIGGIIFIILGIILLGIWTKRLYRWHRINRKWKNALRMREENVSNQDEEFQNDKKLWNEESARLVMENEDLKRIVERLARMKIDSAETATQISEYLGIFRDLNTNDEHLTKVIIYGEGRLDDMLSELLRLPEKRSDPS